MEALVSYLESTAPAAVCEMVIVFGSVRLFLLVASYLFETRSPATTVDRCRYLKVMVACSNACGFGTPPECSNLAVVEVWELLVDTPATEELTHRRHVDCVGRGRFITVRVIIE